MGYVHEIFTKDVSVKLGIINDEVTVDGYEGSVTTDFIASQIFRVSENLSWDKPTEESKRLAKCLADKVFHALKNLVEAPENQCRLYQISALMRATWSPVTSKEFGTSTALRHALSLGCLHFSKY